MLSFFSRRFKSHPQALFLTNLLADLLEKLSKSGYLGYPGYPVARRERFGARGISIPYTFPMKNVGAKERLGYSYSLHIPYEKWGAVRSYLEFPNHLIAGMG